MRNGEGQDQGSPFDLKTIEHELARDLRLLSFAEPALERAYRLEDRDGARRHNRLVIATLVAIFDAFIIPERQALPEVVPVSAVLRFAVLTPLAIAFLAADWRGWLARWHGTAVAVLIVVPTVIAAIESLWVTSPTATATYQAVPLIMLTILSSHMDVRRAIGVLACSCVVFIGTVAHARFIATGFRSSMILTDLAIAASVLMFIWRLDVRNRQIFLFRQHATIGRDLLARQNRRLARLTQIDALTGLGNRRCFDEAMAALWEPGAQHCWPVALILFDIDCFKQFNDALGHQAGDECLKVVAQTVSVCLRDNRDTVVRHGGEEFAIILPVAEFEAACAVAERVRQAVMACGLPHPGGGPADVVTISLGVGWARHPRGNSACLVEAADKALYAAKRQGRNRVAWGGAAAGSQEEALHFGLLP